MAAARIYQHKLVGDDKSDPAQDAGQRSSGTKKDKKKKIKHDYEIPRATAAR